MRKRTLLMLLLLLAYSGGGALINVAVAWGAFETSRVKNLVSAATSFGAMAGARIDGKTAIEGRECQWSFNSYDCIVNLRELSNFDQSHDPGWRRTINGRVCTTVRIGWPVRTLHGQFMLGDYSKAVTIDQVRRSIRSPETFGFAINTLFYAAILWLLFAAPGVIRRRVRRKRGLCAACAYDLRGSDSKTCPECGKVVRT